MILPLEAHQQNPSSSEGTCPVKPTTTHANTTRRRRRQETKEKFIVFSIARSFITTPALAHFRSRGGGKTVDTRPFSDTCLAPFWYFGPLSKNRFNPDFRRLFWSFLIVFSMWSVRWKIADYWFPQRFLKSVVYVHIYIWQWKIIYIVIL